MSSDARAKAAGLPCWSGPVEPEPLTGGITNINFVVRDGALRYFVRIGEDIPIHGVLRFNEVAAARAAERAGVSPALIYTEPGVIVTHFIEGRTLEAADLRATERLEPVVALIRRVHHEMPKYLRGPTLFFWVFHVIPDYAATLREDGSPRVALLNDLLTRAEKMEQAVGPIDVVFGHNDLLAANFIEDGNRLWLVDWDYAGFNSPLFDLANLASNNEYTPDMEAALLEAYFGAPPEDGLLRAFAAMKCASTLRETMWSMVSEIHSTLDFDYVAYTDENMARFERAYAQFAAME
ncbi:MAG: phosphotransferase [Kiloniellales bacterium]